MNEKLLSVKELASELGRARSYVEAMKSKGFIMPGGRTTVGRALSWLARNPAPRGTGTKRDTHSVELHAV